MLLKLALLGWSLASAQGASLDAHRHFTDFFMGLKIARAKDEANITRDMSETVERAFLISDAYLRQGEDRHAENAEVSAFAASRRDRFLGICGSNLDWEDGPAELERCLALPAMRGVKLHLRWFKQRLSGAAFAARFEALCGAAEARRAFFLIHMNLDGQAREELDLLLAAARRHPNSRFIIAHAAEEAMEELAASGGVSNVYTEVSTFQARDKDKLVPALRSFGLDRVLFGVDGPGYGAKKSLEAFRALGFTEEEQARILQANGLAFWDAVAR